MSSPLQGSEPGMCDRESKDRFPDAFQDKICTDGRRERQAGYAS
ncbi:hypothetical protein HMPREF1868_01424 [Olsenella sp. DNF00959]|nr:hypothetical protein HMPREF1868_01424 [Olsenella sp. DNF00959]